MALIGINIPFSIVVLTLAFLLEKKIYEETTGVDFRKRVVGFGPNLTLGKKYLLSINAKK